MARRVRRIFECLQRRSNDGQARAATAIEAHRSRRRFPTGAQLAFTRDAGRRGSARPVRRRVELFECVAASSPSSPRARQRIERVSAPSSSARQRVERVSAPSSSARRARQRIERVSAPSASSSSAHRARQRPELVSASSASRPELVSAPSSSSHRARQRTELVIAPSSSAHRTPRTSRTPRTPRRATPPMPPTPPSKSRRHHPQKTTPSQLPAFGHLRSRRSTPSTKLLLRR